MPISSFDHLMAVFQFICTPDKPPSANKAAKRSGHGATRASVPSGRTAGRAAAMAGGHETQPYAPTSSRRAPRSARCGPRTGRLSATQKELGPMVTVAAPAAGLAAVQDARSAIGGYARSTKVLNAMDPPPGRRAAPVELSVAACLTSPKNSPKKSKRSRARGRGRARSVCQAGPAAGAVR